jgi:hypothetical protein
MERCGAKERCSLHVDGRFDVIEADPGNTMNTFALPCKYGFICIWSAPTKCMNMRVQCANSQVFMYLSTIYSPAMQIQDTTNKHGNFSM